MILDEILANTRVQVAEREQRQSLEITMAEAHAAPPARHVFFDAPMSVIAEVKRRSPSAGTIATEVDPVEQAKLYEGAGAAAISVLTDTQYFGGSLDDLRAVRAAVTVPVLCKDFVLTAYQVYEARAHGADLVLLIVAALDDATLAAFQALARGLGMTPLVEVHDQHQLARAIAADATHIGINNRDLTDFSVDLLTTEYLAPLVPDGTVIVSESGIRDRSDVRRVARAGARAVLVGEALMRAASPRDAIAELLT